MGLLPDVLPDVNIVNCQTCGDVPSCRAPTASNGKLLNDRGTYPQSLTKSKRDGSQTCYLWIWTPLP